MKNEEVSIIGGFVVCIIMGIAIGSSPNFSGDKEKNKLIKLKTDTIKLKSDSIQTLNKRLQTSNEKRGRLFLALLYTDIKGKEKELDSLLVEIGKDN